MANELRIKVVFDTGEASRKTKEYAEGSVGALEQSLRKAREELKKAIEGTEQHTQALLKFKQTQAQVNDALGRGFTAIKNTTGASANAAMTMQALNYTIRDSPYFFRDFSLGLLAIGNNLNPLIDGLIKMRIEAGGGGRVLSFLQNNLTGITLAFSIAVSAIQAITFALAKNTEEAEKSKTAYDELTPKVREYSEGQLKGSIAVQQAEILSLEKEKKAVEDFNAMLAKSGAGGVSTVKEFKKQADLDNARKSLDLLKNELYTLGDIEKIRRRIGELTKIQEKSTNKEQIQALELQINALKESEKVLRGTDKPTAQENSLKRLIDDLVGSTQILAKEMNDLLQAANSANYTLVSAMGAQQVTIGDYRRDAQDRRKKIWDRFGFSEMNKTTVPKLKEITEQYFGGLKEGAEDTKKALQGVNHAADIAGNAISNAFLNGKNATDAAVQALKQFVVQLLVVQSLKYVLTAIFAPSSLPTTVAGFFGFGKKTVAQSDSMPATPELSRVLSSANSIAQKQNTTMVVNVRGELVGSGSNLKAIIKKRDKITAKYY